MIKGLGIKLKVRITRVTVYVIGVNTRWSMFTVRYCTHGVARLSGPQRHVTYLGGL